MAKVKEEETVEETVDSVAKANFRALIEVYKVQNPAKYELKKEELEAKLAKL